MRLTGVAVGWVCCLVLACHEQREKCAEVSSAPSASAVAASAPSGSAAPPPSGSAPAPSASASAPPPVEHFAHHAVVQQSVGFYAVLLPPDYEDPAQAKRKYPVVVILHGSGSTELGHGILANTLGRQGVVYVAPRAPHVKEEMVLESKVGWTAWPPYPKEWGEYGSPTFPTAEADKMDVRGLYINHIARCIEDARRRYRTDGRPVVVFGHSQGATFANLFASRRPELVRAYFAYAGNHSKSIPNPLDGTLAKVLKVHKIFPMITHAEGDSVVPVAETRGLIDYFTRHGLEHASLIEPGGNHRFSDAMRAAGKEFVRKWCCGE